MKKINIAFIKELHQNIVENNEEPMMLLANLIKKHDLDCQAEDLIMAYNAVSELTFLSEDQRSGWNPKLDKVLVNFVEVLLPFSKKMVLYDAFDALVEMRSSQTRYSKVTRTAKPVHSNLSVENEQVEHKEPIEEAIIKSEEAPAAENIEEAETPALLDSLTNMFDDLDRSGQNKESFFATLSDALKFALSSDKKTDDKSLSLENRELKAELEDANFQIKQLKDCLNILNKKLTQKDDKIVSLEAKLSDVLHMLKMSDAESIRELRKMKVVVKDGVVEKVI